MSPTIIVTPGPEFSDIDGLACAIAYAELLRMEGKDAHALCIGTLNASIPPFLKEIAQTFEKKLIPFDEAVFVDISDNVIIDRFVGVDTVTEIYDHHFGWEDFWRVKLGEKAKIERIGAAATQVFEEWERRADITALSRESALLLAHAIISNTVNFQVGVTTERDHEALYTLVKLAGLMPGWEEYYFREQQRYIERDPLFALANDIKVDPVFAFAQIEIWESDVFREHCDFERIFPTLGHDRWLINIVDIRGGFSLVVSNVPSLLEKLGESLHISPHGNTLHLPRLMLRKELYPMIRQDS